MKGRKRGSSALLLWCQKHTKGYRNVNVTNLRTAWVDGLAFLALFNTFSPGKVDMDLFEKAPVTDEERLRNLQLAFDGFQEQWGIAALLDAEDMVIVGGPEKLSMLTYLGFLYKHLKPLEENLSANISKHLKPLEENLSANITSSSSSSSSRSSSSHRRVAAGGGPPKSSNSAIGSEQRNGASVAHVHVDGDVDVDADGQSPSMEELARRLHFKSPELANTPKFAFQWVRRMGVHYAYHQSALNRIVHMILIPFQLWGFLQVLQGFHAYADLMLLACLTPLYVATDIVLGSTFVLFLTVLRFVSLGGYSGTLAGAAAFLAANLAQTQLAHRFLEPGSRDDTHKNIDEFKESKNPIPLLLVFFYHWAEAFFFFGFRPNIKRLVQRYKEEHIKSF